ncbi:YncE family protein [Streptomyces sp. NPDC018045]|uniref:YncE family protein n=1 Tax=Streptomyces sp. NPDC018045 TaxID=3365037 RepID=UPI0037BA5977
MSAAAPRRPVLAVVTSTGQALRFFDGHTYEPLGDLSVAAQPHEIAADPERGLLYVSHTYRSGVYTAPGTKAHEISVIDPYRRDLVDVIALDPEQAPHGLALDHRGGLLYVTVEAGPAGGGALVGIDTATRKPVRRIEVGTRGPHWVVVTPDGTKAYTTGKEAPFVSVIELERGQLIRQIPMPYGTEELALSPDGRFVYVAAAMVNYTGGDGDQHPACLKAVETAHDLVVHTVPLDHPASPVHVTADGRVLTGLVRFSAPGVPAGGLLKVFQPGTEPGVLSHRFTTEVGKVPLTIRTTPDSSRAFVANLRDGTLDIVDLATGAHMRRLDIDPGDPAHVQGAHGIAYLPPRRT